MGRRAMANSCPTTTTHPSLLFFLLSCLLIGHALCNQVNGADYGEKYSQQELPLENMDLQEQVMGLNKKTGKYARRLMIGSTAPICTYNECRGCRFKCSAEQVPVDANDPMNSAYHYKCVCHR